MLAPSKMKLDKLQEENTKGIYSISPLPKGYGHTLGNSLRRILLSSIPGSAPFKVYIKNASHEFAVIKGIKEDVFNILLNLKKVHFQIKSEDFDPIKVTISKKGVGSVKASDIKIPSDVSISNPNQIICTITDASTSFEAEIFIKKGFGYVPREEYMSSSSEVGVIYLDTVFSPILSVNYSVDNARLGKNTELDNLIIDITTNGSMKPFYALKYASALLRDFFGYIATDLDIVLEEDVTTDTESALVDERYQKAKEILIEELNLPTRTINALKKHGVSTLKDLALLDEDQLLSVRNLGEKSIQEIRKLLKKEGLTD